MFSRFLSLSLSLSISLSLSLCLSLSLPLKCDVYDSVTERWTQLEMFTKHYHHFISLFSFSLPLIWYVQNPETERWVQLEMTNPYRYFFFIFLFLSLSLCVSLSLYCKISRILGQKDGSSWKCVLNLTDIIIHHLKELFNEFYCMMQSNFLKK